MNIKDFLIDNYIWILVVILLSIITVIGFLADKKREKKEKTIKKNDQIISNQPVNAPPINYQTPPMNNPYPNQINPINNQMPNIMNNQGINEPINNPIPKPINDPSAMINPNNMMNNNFNGINNNFNISNQIPNQTIPKPVSVQPIMSSPQPVENINPMNNINAEPLYQPSIESVSPIPTPVPSQPTPIPSYQNVTPLKPVGNMNQFNNQGMYSQPENLTPNQNTTIPTPTYQPSQPMNQENNPIPQFQNNIPNNQIPNPQVTTPQSINFVYGPTNNNNQQ